MKIYAKFKHSPYGIIYKFNNKEELLEYAKKRKINVTSGLTEREEKFTPSTNKTIYELLDFCNLEMVKR